MPADVLAPRRPAIPWGWMLAALALVLAGVVGYFVVVFNVPGSPAVRNHGVPNWLLIGFGLGLGVLAVRRAPGRWLPRLLLGVDAALAGVFAWLFYGMLSLPAAAGPAIGAAAPDFALLDQRGTLVRSADFRGSPLLLVFYRGHW